MLLGTAVLNIAISVPAVQTRLCQRVMQSVFWRFCATLSDFADITVLRQNDANRVHNLIHYSRWIICILNLLQAEMLFSLIQCSPPTFPCRPLKKERFHSCHPVARFRIVRMCTASPTGLEWNHSTPCKQTAISLFNSRVHTSSETWRE